ncbi:peptide chain release factor N(5)-glutamine methyltransferase [Jannaschia seohaensis]|uniref:Release factor glutamine methyltransferase n=1 Tax=Jannaschia seohaensis TaxID=475081 RepID=A0A2Y9AA86_9RHOB|nr:peptide chain release factor N(5)-glutamine methyltransferase [Jannaschia seohaensis]PWJ21061.1 release factor glutamine methyltransferase [Jannaschia seohaensis]SSA41471.1 release factor glutamine methyltransferase [Jannaschia seohaensis]
MSDAIARLATAGVPDPAGDLRRLKRAFEGADLEAAIARRAAREPVSHILGRRAFWKHEFEVTADVLDPRPETETLVEAAVSSALSSVLDLGTGSGCILLSILDAYPQARGLGTDLSPAALAVATRNAARLGLSDRAAFRQADWVDGIDGTFDLIVSNPPYIAEAEMAGLSPEVLHEPHLALTPGGDGLAAYRVITRDAPARLAPGGRLMVEIGPTQGQAVHALFEQSGLTEIQLLNDLDGRNRVVSGKKPR